MEIKVFENYEALSKAAAQEFIREVKNNPKLVLGLATGSSPIGLYKELAKDHQENHTSYQTVTTFNLDEYVGIQKDHPQSYYKFMFDNLFNFIDINKELVNIPSGAVEDVLAECEAYNQKLAQTKIDIQVLGIGGNGHIGFNEPGTPFDSVTHQVQLDQNTRQDNARFFDSIDEVPTHAVSMGIKSILQAKKILLIASGLHKADAINAMVNGPIDPSCPASALQTHEHVILFIDQEAASKL
jgi:glucosamine-6-phosphate deaminase